jgi:hypothetical protein
VFKGKKYKIHIDKYTSGRFLIQQDLEKRKVFSPQFCFSTHCGEWFKRTKNDANEWGTSTSVPNISVYGQKKSIR